jgi:hypothetical protein
MVDTFRSFKACGLLLGAAALLCSSPVRAAAINYGNFGPIPPGIAFQNVIESSGTDPVPMFGPPTTFPIGMNFNPMSFVSSATGGASDITEGQLNFTAANTASPSGNAITTIGIFESGDFTLTGTGTAATQALAGAIIRASVTEINGVPVAPISLAPSNASVTFNLLSNPGAVQPWSLGTTINVAGQLPAGQSATRVDVVIDNSLSTVSQASSIAFIAKKDFVVTLQRSNVTIPEPGTLGLAVTALLAVGAPRRRARR